MDAMPTQDPERKPPYGGGCFLRLLSGCIIDKLLTQPTKNAQLLEINGAPYGTRTRVTALRERILRFSVFILVR